MHEELMGLLGSWWNNKVICNYFSSWKSKVMLMKTVSYVNGFGSHHKAEAANKLKKKHKVERNTIQSRNRIRTILMVEGLKTNPCCRNCFSPQSSLPLPSGNRVII